MKPLPPAASSNRNSLEVRLQQRVALVAEVRRRYDVTAGNLEVVKRRARVIVLVEPVALLSFLRISFTKHDAAGVGGGAIYGLKQLLLLVARKTELAASVTIFICVVVAVPPPPPSICSRSFDHKLLFPHLN